MLVRRQLLSHADRPAIKFVVASSINRFKLSDVLGVRINVGQINYFILVLDNEMGINVSPLDLF